MPASVASSGTAEFEAPEFAAALRFCLRNLVIKLPPGDHSSMDELICFAHAVECSGAEACRRPQMMCTIPSVYKSWATMVPADMQRRFRMCTLSSAVMLVYPLRKTCLNCFRPWPIDRGAIRTTAFR